MTTSDAAANYRRVAILEATAEVFRRYGFRKTSMDDLARAAGLSRQGLYLHFRTKEELHRAAIMNVADGAGAACLAALSRDDLSLLDRLLGAFEAFHGRQVGQPRGERVDEFLEAESRLLGDVLREHERRFVAAVARLLSQSGATRRVTGLDVGPSELAETLFATSLGLTHLAATPAEYRDRMAVALRVGLADLPPGETAGRRAVSNFPNR